MKFQCRRKELLEAFSLAASVVSGKGGRPGPQEVLMEILPDGTQVLSATDLEVSLKRRWKTEGVEVAEAGAAAIPADKSLSILRELPGEEVTVEREGNTVHIFSRKSRFKVVALPAEEYPPLPEATWANKVVLPSDLFLKMVNQTGFATATERVHYSLNGVYLVVEKGGVRMVGTDGRRLAVHAAKVKGLKDEVLKGIVPNKGIRLFEKLAGNGDEVTFSLEKNQLFLGAEGTEASTLLIEGTYPDFNRVIPKGNDRVLEISVSDLLSGLRQASILAGEEAKAVRFTMEKDKVTLQSESAGAGEAKVELPAVYDAAPVDLQFNPLFFMDFLRQVDQERVAIKFKDNETAALIQVGSEYTYVVMPLVAH